MDFDKIERTFFNIIAKPKIKHRILILKHSRQGTQKFIVEKNEVGNGYLDIKI